jgi:hypothetical protein
MNARTIAVWLEDADLGLMKFDSIEEAARYYADEKPDQTYPEAACEWWGNRDGNVYCFDITDRMERAVRIERVQATEADRHIAALRGQQL